MRWLLEKCGIRVVPCGRTVGVLRACATLFGGVRVHVARLVVHCRVVRGGPHPFRVVATITYVYMVILPPLVGVHIYIYMGRCAIGGCVGVMCWLRAMCDGSWFLHLGWSVLLWWVGVCR